MVNCDYLTETLAAVQDNNFPGTEEWMPYDELLRRAKLGRGTYWAVAVIEPGPPPPMLLAVE